LTRNGRLAATQEGGNGHRKRQRQLHGRCRIVRIMSMVDVAGARLWLTENLTASDREYAAGGFFRVVAAYVAGLPDVDEELVRVAGLLSSYDHGPGRRPDISLNGDDEDTADVIGEILDDDIMDSNEDTADTGDGADCCSVDRADDPPLSRESPAAFLHDLVLAAAAWLARDAIEVDRFARD